MTSEGRIGAVLDCTLRASGQHLRFEQRDGRAFWVPPDQLADPVLTPEDLDATDDIAGASVLVILRHRASAAEYSWTFPLELRSEGGVMISAGTARIEIDMERFAAGTQLANGVWDGKLQVWIGGWRANVPAASDGTPEEHRLVVGTPVCQ